MLKDAGQGFLLDLDAKAVMAGEKTNMFQDAMKYGAIQDCKDRMAELEAELRDHLKDIRTILQVTQRPLDPLTL